MTVKSKQQKTHPNMSLQVISMNSVTRCLNCRVESQKTSLPSV